MIVQMMVCVETVITVVKIYKQVCAHMWLVLLESSVIVIFPQMMLLKYFEEQS